VRDRIEERGGSVQLESDVVRVCREGDRITAVVVGDEAEPRRVEGTDFISSMPVTELIKKLDPPPAGNVLQAAGALSHRDFLTVCLIVDKPELFPDNWIYVHDPAVMVGRIQNYKNWSPHMVPDATKTGLGLEYFCTEGDELWNCSDQDLIERAKRELDKIGLASYADVIDGCVIRVAKAYPVYDSAYGEHLDTIRQYVDRLQNLQTIGRNGLHRYNNQDHAMMTGMLAVRNLMLGERNDLWAVNTDDEYHEEVSIPSLSPQTIEALEAAFAQMFWRLDRAAFGIALGATAGLGLMLATLVLVVKGGTVVGPNLALLEQYFPGYSVTPVGALLGLAYGCASGFAVGWLFAAIRNLAVFVYTAAIRLRAQAAFFRRFLDYI
jgi:hypothetical protein